MNQKTIKKFIDRWINHGYEKGESQIFWTTLLTDIFEIEDVADLIKFEQQINSKFIDALISSTNVLIEQKSIGRNLDDAFNQAKEYDNELPFNKKSRWIVTSDFQQFQIYDMNDPKSPPKIILLSELADRIDELRFLVEPEIPQEIKISIKAGDLTKKIRNLLLKSYKNPSEENQISTDKLCTRLVFCLYAEAAGLFKPFQFNNYLNPIDENLSRQALVDLFNTLNTPINQRDSELDDILAEFPYVNGKLFSEKISIPKITGELKFYLFSKPNDLPNFKWSMINPTIYGSVLESTLSLTHKKTSKDKKIAEEEKNIRRESGVHYTSVENIHKLIDPLFMDELRSEFENCKGDQDKLKALQDKLSKLKFLDPACGSGNFLTETYISLRQLENEILRELGDGEIKISIEQFHGIEINDFAASLAKMALWIAERQMMALTAEILNKKLEFLPIKATPNIETANALKIDWQSVDYIIGNPPFVGHQWRSDSQIEDMKIVFHDQPKHGKLDYVCAWYKKAADFIKGTSIKCAFVSTNSICQGESVSTMWQPLFKIGLKINFAYRSFKWYNDADNNAHVHCVIIGFSMIDSSKKIIFDGNEKIFAKNINGYLLDAPNIFIQSRGESLQNMPKMNKGSQPTDGGNLILTQDERDKLIKKFPATAEFIKQYVGAEEFINNKIRYCLWLVDVEPSKYRNIKFIRDRLDKVVEARLNSKTESVRSAAETPYLFTQIRQPSNDFLVVPRVSGDNRKYIPIGYISKDFIVSDAVYTILDANLYIFGILTSIVHNAWTRIFCGRLGMSYRYSPAIYNNFPFCSPSPAQYQKIESTAKKILEVRKNFPTSSLADLYDDRTMPIELRKAHQANDLAVMKAYNFDPKMTEAEIVGELMKLYQKLTS